jgi:hypothetical protein
MASLGKFKKFHHKHIATQVASFSTPLARAARTSNTSIYLAEGFEVWEIDLNKLRQHGKRVAELASFTWSWQHLLRYENTSQEIVSSKRSKTSKKMSVRSVGASILAGKLKEAIEWVEENDHSEDIVRILVVPFLGLHALWLLGKDSDRIVLFDAMKKVGKLNQMTFYSETDFLSTLSDQKKTMSKVKRINCTKSKPCARNPFHVA